MEWLHLAKDKTISGLQCLICGLPVRLVDLDKSIILKTCCQTDQLRMNLATYLLLSLDLSLLKTIYWFEADK